MNYLYTSESQNCGGVYFQGWVSTTGSSLLRAKNISKQSTYYASIERRLFEQMTIRKFGISKLTLSINFNKFIEEKLNTKKCQCKNRRRSA